MANQTSTPDDDIQTQILLKEADEALRQERLEALWKQWGQTIVGIALMLVFGTMIGVGWRNWRESVHAEQTQALLEAQDQGLFGLTQAENEGIDGEYKGLASILVAGQLSRDTDTDQTPTIHTLMKQATETGLENDIQAVAEWTKLRIEANQATDAATSIAIADQMIELAEERGNPYRPSILVEAATLYGENGQPQKALDVLKDASADDITETQPSLQTMIDQLTHLYTIDVAQQKAKE